MRAALSVLALLALCVAVACTAPPTNPAPSSRPSPVATSQSTDTVSLSCDNPIDTATVLTAPLSGVLDVVGLDTSTLQANEAGGSAPHQLFAKTGLYVHAGRIATLSVPADWASRVSITWGNAATRWTTTLQIPACPDAEGQWQVFPGGLSLDTPACVPLQVRTGRQVTTVHVSVGTSCPS